MIANDVVAALEGCACIEKVEAVNPGFINIKISEKFIAEYVDEMAKAENVGCEKNIKPKKVVIDYGGPNVAKPLHVGHLRSAIIGETLKRLYEATYTNDVYLTILDEMNIARVEYYFAEMLSILEMPSRAEWIVDLTTTQWKLQLTKVI